MRRLIPRLLEPIVPARLGRSFRWLLSAAVVENAGDGVALAAGPLLVASQTRDPFLVSLAVLSQYLPVFLFGVVGGAAADRLNRKRMVVVVNVIRAVVVLGLAVTIVTGTVSIAVILIVLFIMASAETFADSASSTLLPGLVAREDLGIANARMQGAFLLTNQLVAPPIGAFLFAAGMALPFAANAAAFALSAVLITRVVTSVRAEVGERPGFVAEMAEGIRWLVGHPPMRTLALTIFTFNVTFGAAWSVLVLYASDRLGMDAIGFGLLTTAAAVALGVFVVLGAHGFVWGTTATVVRQRAVPDELLGRVGGVYRVAIVGGMVIGTPLGGLIASGYGITAPFWFGFVGSALLVTLLWRQFDHIAHAGDH